MHKAKRVQKGFTLLEILLVITAIGILAAIVLVAINPTRQISQVRNAERRAEINSIYKGLEQYLIDNQSYTVGGTGITYTPKEVCKTGTEQVGGATNCSDKVDLRVLVPNYLAAIPADPGVINYRVSINSQNNRISVTASGAELGQTIAINLSPPDFTPSNTSWWDSVYLSAISTWSSSNMVTIEGVNTTITLRINVQDPDLIFNGFEIYKNGSIAYSATSSLFDSNFYLDVVSGDIIYFRAKAAYSGTLFYPLFINIYNDSDSGFQLDSLEIHQPDYNNM